MVKNKDILIKFIVVAVLFIVGSSLVLQAFQSVELLWLVIPGVLLIGLAYPWVHVLWAQFRSSYRHKTDEEILAEAEREVRSKYGK